MPESPSPAKSRSLLEQLPEIVRAGKRRAERILEGLEGRTRIGLQTRELVTPAKDSNWQDFLKIGNRKSEIGNCPNRLIYGDNLLAMAALLAGDEETPSLRGKIDLFYIDPPFNSKTNYHTKITLPGGDLEQRPTVIEQFAYSDTWADGTVSYLAMIVPRLCLMRELLSDRGSLYVHLDWHVGHHVKCALDEVFGSAHYINTIVWKRTGAHSHASQGTKNYARVTDCIMFYSKSTNLTWQQLYVPHRQEYVDQMYRYVEPGTGRRYRLDNLTVTDGGPKGNPRYEFLGVVRYWRYNKEKMERLYKEGRVVQTKSGRVPAYKRYLDEMLGAEVPDLWTDINAIASQASERTDYDTQKPEALLERIIKASSNEGSIVSDIFGGSGTTAAVAEKLGRRWIVCDLGKPACMIMRKRLIDQSAQPFLFQAIGDYQVEAARSMLGRKFRIGELAQIVLGLYGALPLDKDDNPNRNLGYLSTGSSRGNEAHTFSPKYQSLLTSAATGKRVLVFVDSPQKLTGLPTLKKAQELRATHLGGWEKVVVLGWNFTPDIGHVITELNDAKLEVLVIPPDLLDRLKKSGGYEKLKADFAAQRIRFSSLQYVTVKPIERKTLPSGEVLTIELDNYVLLSPDALNLEPKNRERLQAVVNRDPLALVEYWSVDPDYDGELFRSVWQDYRGNTENDDDPLHVVRKAVLSGLPVKNGPRRVCVRVVDVFGFEAEVIKTV